MPLTIHLLMIAKGNDILVTNQGALKCDLDSPVPTPEEARSNLESRISLPLSCCFSMLLSRSPPSLSNPLPTYHFSLPAHCFTRSFDSDSVKKNLLIQSDSNGLVDEKRQVRRWVSWFVVCCIWIWIWICICICINFCNVFSLILLFVFVFCVFYCSGCSICTGRMGLRADRFNPLIGFPVSGFPSPGLNLGGGVLTRRVSLDLDLTTCEWIAQDTQYSIFIWSFGTT